MSRQGWTREQLTKALALYCQLPFGKIHSRNPTIIELAVEIGRSPSAVAMKLVNFASLDPELRARGIGGMGNTSAADREIWSMYFGRWDILADAVVIPSPDETSPKRKHPFHASNRTPQGPTEIKRLTKQRRGQSFFRNAVFAAHDGKCCITGITSLSLLRASHIVPWSHDATLRLNPCNGLCLNALHDAAFDKGLITLSDRFALVLSSKLESEVPSTIFVELFERLSGIPVSLPERFIPTQSMLDYHRTHVFVH